jgi:hypothetical protein
MILWGTTNLKSSIEQGEFNCPQCQAVSPYTLKKSTEYFTIYFIPVIPLGVRGKFVECNQCRGAFTEAILSYDPTAEKVATQVTVFRILVAFMVHFQKTGVTHVTSCQSAYSELLGQEIPVEIVEHELQLALEPDSSPKNYILSEGATFAPDAKLQMMASAMDIIESEPVDNEHSRMVLAEFSQMLGFPEADFEQVLEVVAEISLMSKPGLE